MNMAHQQLLSTACQLVGIVIFGIVGLAIFDQLFGSVNGFVGIALGASGLLVGGAIHYTWLSRKLAAERRK